MRYLQMYQSICNRTLFKSTHFSPNNDTKNSWTIRPINASGCEWRMPSFCSILRNYWLQYHWNSIELMFYTFVVGWTQSLLIGSSINLRAAHACVSTDNQYSIIQWRRISTSHLRHSTLLMNNGHFYININWPSQPLTQTGLSSSMLHEI